MLVILRVESRVYGAGGGAKHRRDHCFGLLSLGGDNLGSYGSAVAPGITSVSDPLPLPAPV
nr:hypothetical protein JVH1_7748 [Rhodococcus sp. JVH1]